MGAMGFWECMRQAWSEAAKFIRHRPLAIVVTFAILLTCDAIAPIVGRHHEAAHLAGASIGSTGLSRLIWITSIIKLATMMALPVDVMRYVMSGEQEAGPRRAFGSGFLRYVLLTLIFIIGGVAISALVVGGGYFLTHFFKAYLGGTRLQLTVWGVIAVCVVSYLAIRLSLLFCHVAIGRAMRWRATWKDTGGHFWRIVFSHLLTAVPIQLCMFGALALVKASVRATGTLPFPYADTMIRSLSASVGLVVGATCACWLYRQFARRLLENS